MLAKFKVSQVRDSVGWPKYLAEVSDDWPQHLHNGMRALSAGLVGADGRLGDVDVDWVRGCVLELRNVAYRRRRSRGIRKADRLVAEVMRTVPNEGMGENEIEDRIRELSRPPDDPDGRGRKLPEGWSHEKFLGHLVHRGVLQLNVEEGYYCPIPNFRTFLMKMGGLRSQSLAPVADQS